MLKIKKEKNNTNLQKYVDSKFNKNEMKIPKVIHYCWFGSSRLPKDVKKCIKSWKKVCPDYVIKRWDETNFDIKQNEFIYDAYINKKWAFVSDYARLKIIYDNGGIYLDTDVKLVKKLDDLLAFDSYFGIDQKDGYVATGLGFGATKNNELLDEMLKVYNDLKFDVNNLNKIACPILNTNVLKQYGFIKSNQEIQYISKYNCIFLPPEYFDPIAPGTTNNLLSDNTFSIHMYSASWTSKKNVIKRKFIRFIGVEKFNFLKRLLKGKK